MHIREISTTSTKHPPGTVGIFTDHVARFSDFTVSVSSLNIPEGSIFSWSRGVYLAHNTNRFIREMEGEWLFLMDDDHRFEPDLLTRLLDHDLDVVVSLTTKKFPPYEPLLYTQTGSYDDPNFGLTPLDLKGKFGLVEVDACAKSGMLIRKHVLDAIPDPWCVFIDNELGAEDLDLGMKIRNAGFKIYADLNTSVGHLTPMTVYKQCDPNGNWGSMLALGERGVFLPD